MATLIAAAPLYMIIISPALSGMLLEAFSSNDFLDGASSEVFLRKETLPNSTTPI